MRQFICGSTFVGTVLHTLGEAHNRGPGKITLLYIIGSSVYCIGQFLIGWKRGQVGGGGGVTAYKM
jgi:hypothetical protein